MVPGPSMLGCAPDRSLPMFQQQPQAKLPAGPLSQGCPGLPFAWILLFPGLAQEAKALSMKRAASSNLPQHILFTTKTSREKGKRGRVEVIHSHDLGTFVSYGRRTQGNRSKGTRPCLGYVQSSLGLGYSKLSPEGKT